MKDQPAITVVHNGITITYSEFENKFIFELRGRERKVGSLREAREAIEKPPPKDKKPFNRVKAYAYSYGLMEEGEVTSIAEVSYRSRYVWFVNNMGNRSKQDAAACFPINPKNEELKKAIDRLKSAIGKLNLKIKSLRDKMQGLEITAETE
jgi:hypothetical protein